MLQGPASTIKRARKLRRDRWFEERRFDVLRIPAAEVLRDLEAVVRGIVARAQPAQTRE